ncbi:S1 family peptidase [Flavihumibacter petaseus]|uniref:Peptidase S1 family protein n=1 Tax=Flavihumibacter petaseus NBRC 106054 TaxID=1220578 RepID=A0A0E9N168_9BACT|nr:serine protease [Flavihumibacter petaseus]GAO43604.1 peptidase S1 family protein [Flavihumibacter petaseus NBRC 106054]
MTEDVQMLELAERYLGGDMTEEERTRFDQLRKERPEIDQLVVEHSLFLQQIDQYGDRKSMKTLLHDTHNQLREAGEIREEMPKVRFLQAGKYKRVFAVAASIAGITALAISGMVTYFSPKSSPSEFAQLKREINAVKASQAKAQNQLNTITTKAESLPVRPVDPGKFGGTGFLIDGRGYLVTSAHVVAKADSVYIVNSKGEYFKAKTLHVNEHTDIAILKIADSRFETISRLPYAIRPNRGDLGEQIFTLGYPRTEIVYNEGYLSAKTGLNGDTSAFQLSISANPGNSGGPIFNHNGEIIGVLSGKQLSAEGVVFSSQSKNILRALDSLRTDSSISIRLSQHSALKGIDRVQQIKKIEDCVFNVMSY